MDDELLLKTVENVYERINKHDDKPKWRIFIESSGGAALITVILGGIIGGLLTAAYQARQVDLQRIRSTEQQIAQLRLEAVRKAFDLIFATVGSAEDLIELSSENLKGAPKAQRNDIRKAYNTADSNWRKGRAAVGLPLPYYARDFRATTTAWAKASKSVTDYSDCAGRWVVAHPFYTEGLGAACVEERKRVDDSVSALQAQVLPQS